MPKSKVIMVLGAIIALLPVLGFPRTWEMFFQVLAGLLIVLLSVWSSIDKKLTLKAKAQQRLAKKAAAADPASAVDAQGRRVTDFYPKTGQPGRRISDIQPNTEWDSDNKA